MSLGQATKRRWLNDAMRATVVTVALLAALWRGLDVERLGVLFAEAKLGWLVLAVCMVPLQMVLGGCRWARVTADLGLALNRAHAVTEYGLSMGLNAVMPGGMAGDAVRIWRHRRGHGSLGEPLRAAVVERLIGHWTHLAVTALGLLLWSTIHGVSPPPGSPVLVAVIILVFGFVWTWPLPGLRSLVEDTRVALGSPSRLCVHGGLSLALMASILLAFWACAMALNLPLGLGVFTAVPLLMLVLVLPFSIGGWGLREFSAAVVFAFLGWSTEEAVALSAAYGLTTMLGATPALSVWLRPVRVHS
jgi:glycosyltransferase 2 family protein